MLSRYVTRPFQHPDFQGLGDFFASLLLSRNFSMPVATSSRIQISPQGRKDTLSRYLKEQHHYYRAKQEGDPREILIDLDLDKELNGRPTGARHRTGTMEFIVVKVLKGRPYTYRHDLELYFYVSLWDIVQGRDKTLLKINGLDVGTREATTKWRI
ncbi:hypothetical protein K469DRAFT_705695 [Zopfia rhizophila CBS 207.26]|uniref:Fungal-type protein kinase domain-containing protein n=1 Tax=Zopfia rhizophila CBS 207.26 TaxID=1314779 RepID=A0A6A6E9C6_9PEZI|nr:hypothetical protein K469DRAFT_705695 [Zopfia rhizophila CBS 207.26]